EPGCANVDRQQKVVDGKNPQRAPRVEVAEVARPVARVHQDAGNQETGEDEKQIHAHPAQAGDRIGPVRALGVMKGNDRQYRQPAQPVEFQDSPGGTPLLRQLHVFGTISLILMSTASTSPRARAWNQAELRRLGRSLADWAVAELTQNGAGPVRAADFERRARILLRTRVSPSKVPAWMRQLAAAGMRVNHPAYMAQQIPAPIPLAALVECAVSTLNQSLAVWDMSPAGTLVDRAVMDRFKGLLGFSKDAEGSLTPGGSFANLTALLAARAALDSKAWRAGGARIAILAGAHTHYSIARAAGI